MKRIAMLLVALALLFLCGNVLAAEGAEPVRLHAWLIREPVTLDGNISEMQWAAPAELADGNGLSGRVWAMWQPGKLYLALAYESAQGLSLSLGTSTWNLALAGNMADQGISGIALEKTAELCIDLESAGVTIADYQHTQELQITLHAEQTSTKTELSLVFTGTVAQQKPFTGTVYSNVTVSDDQQMLTLGSATGGYHVLQNVTAIDHSKDVSLRQHNA